MVHQRRQPRSRRAQRQRLTQLAMGTRKHPWTNSHPGLPWFGVDTPPDYEQAVFLHGAPEQGGAALLLCVLKHLLSLRWMMAALVFLSFLSLMVYTLYILGYSLAKSAAKLARSYSVRLAARAHEPLSARRSSACL